MFTPHQVRGDVGEIDVETPLGVVPQHLAIDPVGPAGGGGDVEMLFAEAARDAVVDDRSRRVAHQHIANAPGPLTPIREGVHPVQELGRVRAADLDPAEGRDVDQPDRASDMGRFLLDQPFPVGLRTVEGGTHPVARHHHPRARFDVAVMHRGVPHRLEIPPRQDAQLFPGDRRADGRGPHPGEIPAGAVRRDAERVRRRIPALGRTHSDGRVALHQLDIGVTLVDRIGQVANRQVLVEIDEFLALRMGKDRPGVVALPARIGGDRRRVAGCEAERLRRRPARHGGLRR